MKNIVILFFLFLPCLLFAQTEQSLKEEVAKLNEANIALNHRLDALQKQADDALWFDRLGDAAFIDKVFMVGPGPAKVKNPTAMGATNPVKFWSYVFIPKNIDLNKKYPLLVLPHGGVHADFTTYHTHIIRELPRDTSWWRQNTVEAQDMARLSMSRSITADSRTTIAMPAANT